MHCFVADAAIVPTAPKLEYGGQETRRLMIEGTAEIGENPGLASGRRREWFVPVLAALIELFC